MSRRGSICEPAAADGTARALVRVDGRPAL